MARAALQFCRGTGHQREALRVVWSSGLDFSKSMRAVMLRPEPVRLDAFLNCIWEHGSRNVPLAEYVNN